MVISTLIFRGETKESNQKWNDTMNSLNRKIQAIIRIPSIKPRLIRLGRLLEWEKVIVDGSIQTTTRLHLLNPKHLRPWQIVDEMFSVINHKFCSQCLSSASTHIKNRMNDFFSVSTEENNSYLEILRLCFAPELLVLLYMSPVQDDRLFAAGVIIHILKLSRIDLTKDWRNECACLVLEFCELLRRVSNDDSLYLSCRSTLGLLLKSMDISSWLMHGEDTKGASLMKEIFSFVSEHGNRLCQDLVASTESPWSSGPFFGDICDFKAFLLPLHTAIKWGPSADPILKRGYVEASEYLYATFLKLLRKMNECLLKMQDCLPLNTTWGDVTVWHGWFHYLAILEELHKISEHYKVAEEELWMSLRLRKFSLCVLLVKYLKPTDNIRWLLEHKNKYGCEFKRHLAREIIPKANEDFQRSIKMVVDRFLNGATSFTHVEGHHMLPGDLFSPPRAQEDNPPEIMERWFLSICQAVFNPQNALFTASPNDPTRIYPNPAIKLENLHLEYFSLAGKLIALALIHKLPVGVVFDRVFFLQLAGKNISLEDIRDTDPCLYGNCKKILEMCSKSIASDALELRFIRSPGGKSFVVNRKKGKIFVDLLINFHFVTSISKQCDRRRHVITNWEKGRPLGCGSYASVYEGYAAGGFFFAVKEVQLLDQGNQTKKCIYQIEQEIALLSQFNHPNIVQYYGTDKDETKLYIFLELGTPRWMAPVVINLKRRGGYGLPADIWSLGCTVLEMLIRKRPYSHLEPAQVLYKIGRGEPPPVPDFLSSLSQDFIMQCLQVNPDDRPTAAQLLDHPFVKGS
ncbi:hypothetical protein GH714_006805 [Hevea brasiliensis]|uniref:mitogen-activated protein kinase kinase kinase n=1 Tax=Hevea brasiliensis TaxID=3981 RepID=A0A6A6L2X4_HEVBR|nr:hypothetical protein GH714_006805 [Hevea brasiliensis]